MQKDAYLIIAHNQWNLLKELIKSLDYPGNDIFIHIDTKSVDFSEKEFQGITKYSTVRFYQKYDVRWGTESQVDTEMFLYNKAYCSNTEKYRYYHLISGQDLPIKPIEYIYNYFNNKDIEFLEFGSDNHDMYRFRLGSYHYTDKESLTKRRILSFKNKINEVLGRDRVTKLKFKIYKGSNWASLTNKAVEYLLANQKSIYKATRFSLCADEVYKHTWLMNANVCFNIWKGKDIRYIDWEHYEGTSPHTLRSYDYDALKNSDCLFARKFSWDIDREIIKKVINNIHKE